MIIETSINLKNKNKEELMLLLNESLGVIEKLQQEIEELEEINNELEAEKNEAIRRYNFETIPKQKIKDKIEEYKNMVKTCNKAKDVDRIKAINERVLELEELLEKNEEESKCPKKQENKNIEK